MSLHHVLRYYYNADIHYPMSQTYIALHQISWKNRWSGWTSNESRVLLLISCWFAPGFASSRSSSSVSAAWLSIAALLTVSFEYTTKASQPVVLAAWGEPPSSVFIGMLETSMFASSIRTLEVTGSSTSGCVFPTPLSFLTPSTFDAELVTISILELLSPAVLHAKA